VLILLHTLDKSVLFVHENPRKWWHLVAELDSTNYQWACIS